MNRHAKDKALFDFKNMVNGRRSSNDDDALKVIGQNHRRGQQTNYRTLFHAYQHHDPSTDEYNHHRANNITTHENSSTDTYNIRQPPPPTTTHPSTTSQYARYNPPNRNPPPSSLQPPQPHYHHHPPPPTHRHPPPRHPAYPWEIPRGPRQGRRDREPIVEVIPTLPPTPPAYLRALCAVEGRESQLSHHEERTTADDDEKIQPEEQQAPNSPRPPERVTFVNGRYYPAFSFPSLFHSTSIYIIHSLDSCFLPCGQDILSDENVFNIRLNDVTALHYFPQLLWNIIYTEELRMKKYYIASGIDEINLYIKLRSYDEVEYIKGHIAGSFAHYDIVPINIPAMECCMCIGFNDEEINELGITISRPKTSAVNEVITPEPVTTPSSNQSTEITKTMTMSDGFTEIFSTAGDQREIPFKYSEAVNTDNIDILHTPTPYSQPENDDVYLMTRQAQKKPVGIPVTTPSYAAAARNIIHRKPTTFNNHTLRRQLQPTQKQPTSKKSSRYRFTSYSTSSSDSLKLDMSIIKEEEEDEEEANTNAFTIEEITASDTNIDVCDDMEEATASDTNIDVCDDMEEATTSDTNIDVCDSEVDRIFNLSIFT